jgi:hypothetical protein
MHDDHPIRASDVESGENAIKLRTLKKRMAEEGMVVYFRSPADLRGQLLIELSRIRQANVAVPRYVSDRDAVKGNS